MIEIKGLFEKIHVCVVCKNRKEAEVLTKVEKFGYVCSDCINKQHNYSVNNETRKGKETKKNITFSIEFETCDTTPETAILHKYGFVPTYDGSIGGHEWKSPIYQNMRGVKTIFNNIDKLSQYVNDDCGTHIHVGTLGKRVKNFIFEYEHTLFMPLINKLSDNETRTKKFWGRYFNGYCSEELDGDRYQAINPRTDLPTLEFRLPKYKNSKQYYNCLKFCTSVVELIKSEVSIAIKKEKHHNDYYMERLAKDIGKKICVMYDDFYKNIA